MTKTKTDPKSRMALKGKQRIAFLKKKIAAELKRLKAATAANRGHEPSKRMLDLRQRIRERRRELRGLEQAASVKPRARIWDEPSDDSLPDEPKKR